jgi:hypothetical protein
MRVFESNVDTPQLSVVVGFVPLASSPVGSKLLGVYGKPVAPWHVPPEQVPPHDAPQAPQFA